MNDYEYKPRELRAPLDDVVLG
ncbi:MAG: hypothetical protein ACD_21C00241G0001, partial [uncultured bacterium]